MTRVARASVVLLLMLLVASAADAREWSWLGVRIRDLSEQEMDDIAGRHGLGEGFGVFIVEVMPDTPASRAGVRPGDVIVALDGRPVTDTRLLQRLIARAPTDSDVRLTVLRREGRQALGVRLMTMPSGVAGERIAAEFGFVPRAADNAAGEGVRLMAGPPSVSFVGKGGSAEKAGLEVGDVILQINERAVLTRDATREALSDVPLERPLRLTVRRGEERIPLTLPPPESRP